jgi:hypothetical protein
MRLIMGFGDFKTTKGKAAIDNHTTSPRGARKILTIYELEGGFN